MNEAIDLTYTTTPDMMKRAATAWARPQLSPAQKLLRWLGVVAGGAVLGGGLVATGLVAGMPDGFWTGLLVGFYAGLLLWLVFHSMNAKKLLGFANAFQARSGETQMTLSSQGIATSSQIAKGEMTWPCIDQVIELSDATVLRAGAFVYPIPDTALPEGITPQDLRRRVLLWKEGRAMKAPLGVILAGGLATRMGGGDKGLLSLGQTTLLDHVIDRLSPQVSDLALNANGDAARFARFGRAGFTRQYPGFCRAACRGFGGA